MLVRRELHEVIAFALGALGALAVVATFLLVVYGGAGERRSLAPPPAKLQRVRLHLSPCAVFAEPPDWRCGT